MQPAQVRRFNRTASLSLAILMCAGLSGTAVAQQSAAPATPAAQPAAPARDIPRPDQLEPGVTTMPAAPASAAPAPAPAAPDMPAASGAAPASSTADAAPASGATGSRKGEAADKSAARKGPDRLQLDPTQITGNRELPKVLYIVPWKRSDLGDLAGRPVNSLLDEVLQPLDRDVFQRENRYYDALKPDQAAPKAAPAQGSESKP